MRANAANHALQEQERPANAMNAQPPMVSSRALWQHVFTKHMQMSTRLPQATRRAAHIQAHGNQLPSPFTFQAGATPPGNQELTTVRRMENA
eukprot:3870338-Alexandrium_andersonii.AAC.1